MLKEIIQQILSGRMKSKQEIAEAIGVQKETLEDMLELLVKKGLLRTSHCEANDIPSCAGCSHASSACMSDNFGQAYYVTQRGKKYAEME